MAEREPADKLSHRQVAYEHPARGKDHCSICRHYIEDGPRCESVRSPIRAEDWCIRFRNKEELP